jgi:hypothetical protein
MRRAVLRSQVEKGGAAGRAVERKAWISHWDYPEVITTPSELGLQD